MDNKGEKKVQFPKLYTIHSQKGGVGKTSIAIAIAGFAALVHKKKALIIDMDMTGVSLYDLAGWADGKDPRYLNEILLATPPRYEAILNNKKRNDSDDALDDYFHNVPKCEKIKFIPASPCIDDITCIIPLISQEDFHCFFRYRLEDIIAASINREFEVIVIDNSPGLFGISKSTLQMALEGHFKHSLLNKTIGTQAVIVASTDPPDYLSLFPSLSNIHEQSKNEESTFALILNKISDSRDEVFIYKQLLDDLSKKKFADNRILHPGFIDVAKNCVIETGGLAAPYVAGFSLSDILPTIEGIQLNSFSSGNFQKWCQNIGKACGL